MFDFLTHLFDTTGFPARWNCGDWTPAHGWMHILSDLAVWSAYFAIPCILVYFVLRRRDVPFPNIFWLFGAFILACGTTHLMEAIVFWHPVYRLAGVIKVLTAVVSWGTVAALVPTIPKALAMRTPDELEREIAARKEAENALQRANAELESRVQERTKELAQANASLRYEREMLRITLASIGDAVVVTDINGRVTFLNSVAQSLTGWQGEESEGQNLETVFRIINEQTRKPVENPAVRALKEGVIVGLANHTILIAKDGTERAIDDSAAPIQHESGDVAGVVLVFRDVTEQRKAQRSARFLASIVESSEDAIIGKDVSGIITSWNQGAERIFGYTAAEAVGRPIAMLAPSDRTDEMPGILKRIRRGERVEHFDTVRRAKDGRLVPISLTVSPIKDEDGIIIGASKIARDISQRKQVEEALHAEKERLHATLTGIGDAVIVTDAGGRITLLNPVAQTLTGWKEEAAGRQLGEVFRIINEQTREPVQSPVNRVIREGTVVGLANHTTLVAKDGTERPIEDSAAPIRAENGEVVGVVLVFRDVTERRRGEESLRRTREELQIVTQSMSVPVSRCSRDLRYLWVNQYYADWICRSSNEIVGAAILDIIGPQAFEQLRPHFDQVLSGQEVRYEERVEFRGIGPRWINVVYTPTLNAQGVPDGWVAVVIDVDDRKRMEEALRASEDRLAAELEGMTRLHAVSTRLLSADNISTALDDVLENAIRTSGADFGNIQLYNPQIGALEIVVQRGFHQDFLDYFRTVRADDGSACAQAMRSGDRIIIEDVELDPGFAPHRHVAAAAGYRAVQSTPLKSRGGSVLGMLSTHFCEPHRPSARDERLLDLYARHAADLIERIRFEEALHRSEAQFHQLADAMPQIVWTARPDGYLDYYNERWYEYTGFPREEYGQQSWEPILHPDDVQRCVDTYFGCIKTEKPYQIEYRFKDRKTGGFRWFLGRAMPVRDESDKIVRWFGTCTDIDDTKKAGERLRLLWEAAAVMLSSAEPDAMLRELFANIGPHFGLDAYFNYILTETDDALRLVSSIGIPDEAVSRITRLELGQAIGGVVALNHQPIVLTNIQQSEDPKARLLKSFGIRAYACHPLQVNNELLGTLAFASRSRDQFNPDDLDFFQTICQYVAVAYERLRLVRQLRDADRRKDEFLATLAHELRNPLAPIRNAVELLSRWDGNADLVEEARSIMGRQLDQMVRLVDDLLDVTRISQGKVQVRKERVELAAVVLSAVEAVRPVIEAQAHEFTLTVPPEAIYVDADPTRLAQVILNLLNNAAKYTEKGGHIWLTAERHGDEAVVSVRDTGIGIAAEHLPRIFEMFSQVAPALERSQGGLGIGLSLVRGLIELHGGKVEARSEGVGKGSEFIVRLPVADAPIHQQLEEPADGATIPIARKCRILAVDDNRDAANSLAIMLRMMGHESRTAYDGLEAVQVAATFRPDVVLLDIGLPKLNGYEAARRIRQQPWGKGVALIALTGWGQEEDKRRALEAGFDHHLTKPVDAAAVENMVALMIPAPEP
jgi:PAS domain S-box-containing protein